MHQDFASRITLAAFPALLSGAERSRRSGRQQPVTTRRMVALYDYDPRESSPNVDVEVGAELRGRGHARGTSSELQMLLRWL